MAFAVIRSEMEEELVSSLFNPNFVFGTEKRIVSLLLRFTSLNVNAISNHQETAMDLAEKLQYGGPAFQIKEALTEAGAKYARQVGQLDEAMELKRTVGDIKHDVHSQLVHNEKTQRRVSGIAKELKKILQEAVQNTINSVTVVAVLFAFIAFLAIFNLPGQYVMVELETGKANVASNTAFQAFCLLNATSLFITMIPWDTRAQRQIVSVVNKLMWAFVVIGRGSSWMAITITALGVPLLRSNTSDSIRLTL